MGKPSYIKRMVVLLLVLAGGILRYQTVTETEVINPVRADAGKYVSCAMNLKYLGVYANTFPKLKGDAAAIKPDALISPGYPLFLMPFLDDEEHGFSSRNYRIVLFIQVLLSTLTVLMAYMLFSAFMGATGATFAAVLTALSPHLINMSTYVVTETLFCFFLIAFFLSLTQRGITKSFGKLMVAGCLLGAATLVRPWTQGYVFILFIFLTCSSISMPLKKASGLLAGFVLVVMPWVLRNIVNLGYASDPTLSITSIYHGSFPGMMYHGIPSSIGFAYVMDPRANELASSLSLLWQELAGHFRADPWTYINWYVFGKVATVFSWDILGGVGDIYQYPMASTPFANRMYFIIIHDVMKLIHVPITTIGLLACLWVMLPMRYTRIGGATVMLPRIVALLVFYFVVLHVIGAPYSRYSIPLRPLIYGMATLGMTFFAVRVMPFGARLKSAILFRPSR